MKHIYGLLILPCILFFLSSCVPESYRVTAVKDGNTFIVDETVIIHLDGIKKSDSNFTRLRKCIQNELVLIYNDDKSGWVRPKPYDTCTITKVYLVTQKKYLEFGIFDFEEPPSKEPPATPGDDIGNLVEQNKHSVVFCRKINGIISDSTRGAACSVGTCFFVTSDGIFLTADHIMDGKTWDYTLYNYDSVRSISFDSILPVKRLRKADVFIGKVHLNGNYRLSPVSISDEMPYYGEKIFIMGYPQNNDQKNIYRYEKIDDSIGVFICTQDDRIITNCIAGDGNSGGPLFNKNGEAIGIVLGNDTVSYWLTNYPTRSFYSHICTISRKLGDLKSYFP